MYPTPTYVAEQVARDYTRDRIRDTRARQMGREVDEVVRERRYIVSAAAPAAPPRRWRFFPARATTA